MRYCQLNQITRLEPGVILQATRTLRADEDYLKDHFPRFAVMPGVIMLEALTQASCLLARATEGYRSGLVYLQTAKNVKFADFLQPGQTLNITAEILKTDGQTTLVKAIGHKGDSVAVSGRLVLKHQMLSENGEPSTRDRHAGFFMKQLTDRLLQQQLVATD